LTGLLLPVALYSRPGFLLRRPADYRPDGAPEETANRSPFTGRAVFCFGVRLRDRQD